MTMTCEGCGKHIRSGEKCARWADDVYTCEKCTPTDCPDCDGAGYYKTENGIGSKTCETCNGKGGWPAAAQPAA
jgi:hypothetical protein